MLYKFDFYFILFLCFKEDNGIQALQEICDIMRSSDVSPFEVIHSGLVNKLLQYLTANSATVARDERIRRFLHVFLNCPVSCFVKFFTFVSILLVNTYAY